MVSAILLAAAVTASAPDASAQAYAHVIAAERFAAKGDIAGAVSELRYALIFDYDSQYLRTRLRQLTHDKPNRKLVSKRRGIALDPRLQADTPAPTEREKNVAERSSE